MYDVHADIVFEYGLPAVINSPRATEIARSAAWDTTTVDKVVSQGYPSLGGEDFSYYQQKVPGALVRVGSACGDHGRAHLHSPHFDVDEEVIRVAVSLFTRSILQWVPD